MTWDFMWTSFTVYVFLAFLFLLFIVLRDLFRSDISGTAKALWVVALVFLPILSTIGYLEKLVRQGTHGTSVPGVAKTLIEEGIRLAIKDGLLSIRDNTKGNNNGHS